MVDLESSDMILSIDKASKNGGGIGISIQKTRQTHASFIATSPSPNFLNWVTQYTENIHRWIVSATNYPDIQVFTNSDADMMRQYYNPSCKMFERRIDAEKFKLEKTIKNILSINAPAERYWPKVLTVSNCFWLSDENKQLYIDTKYDLEHLEENHPEWLI